MSETPQYLTCAQVAALFGIPTEHIRRKAIKKQIPHTRFGRRHIRFSPEDVAAIERMHRVEPRVHWSKSMAGSSARNRRPAACGTSQSPNSSQTSCSDISQRASANWTAVAVATVHTCSSVAMVDTCADRISSGVRGDPP